LKISVDINDKYQDLQVAIGHHTMTPQVTELMKRLESPSQVNLMGKLDESLYILQAEEIVCIYTQGTKVKASCGDRVYDLKEKLYQLENLLEDRGFIRLSKFAIANVSKIKRIDVAFNGSMEVVFSNDQTEVISRRQVKAVKSYLGIGGK